MFSGNTKLQKGDFLIFIAMLIFGSYPLFLRLFPSIPTLVFLFAFQVVGALAFLMLAIHKGFSNINKKNIFLFLILSVVALGNDLSYFSSFRLTSVGNAAIAHQTVSFFLIFLSPIILKEEIKKNEVVALLIAFCGIIVLYSQSIKLSNPNDIIGISLGLLSALFYAFLIIIYRYLPKYNISITTINFWRYSFSVILLTPLMFKFIDYKFSQTEILPLLSFGFLFAVIASGIHNLGLSLTKSIHSSIIGKTEPVIVIVYGYIILGEVITFQVLIAGLLIVGPSLWLVLKKSSTKI